MSARTSKESTRERMGCRSIAVSRRRRGPFQYVDVETERHFYLCKAAST